MNAYTQPRQARSKRPGISPRAFLILGLSLVFIFPLALMRSQTQPGRVAYVTWPSGHKVQYNTHAEKHAESADIRACLEQKGPYQTWANQKTGDWYFPCQLPNGKWGTLVAKKVNGVYQEMSTYIKEPGSWTKFLRWMQDWGATRVTGAS